MYESQRERQISALPNSKNRSLNGFFKFRLNARSALASVKIGFACLSFRATNVECCQRVHLQDEN